MPGLGAARVQCLVGGQALAQGVEKVTTSANSIVSGSEKLRESATTLANQHGSLNEKIKLLAESIVKQESMLTSTPEKLTELLQSIGNRLATHVNERSVEIGKTLQQGIQPSIDNAATKLSAAAADCQRSSSGCAQ